VVAQKAGKAVPAVAMVGALAVAPSAHTSSGFAPGASQVIHSRLDAAVRPAHVASVARPASAARPGRHAYAAHPALAAPQARHADADRAYTVQSGDTLSGIAFRSYGRARAWPWLYQVNRAEITNPNLIFPGQVLRVPRHIPPSFHGIRTETDGAVETDNPQQAAGSGSASSQPQATGVPQGTLGCSGLEVLWQAAGGAPSEKVTAASIAVAESSGNQYATGSYGERGYWQINPVHGGLSTYDAYGNARAAVIISGDGTNWSPWTTFVDGAYSGRC
jgi:LysM repeat protein